MPYKYLTPILILLVLSIFVTSCRDSSGPPDKTLDLPSDTLDFSEDIFEAEKVKYGDVVASKIMSVYDGDTFTINVDGWPEIIGRKISIRVAGIDTPEIRDKRAEIKILALAAKDFANKRLRCADKVELLDMRRDKYFRILAIAEIDGDNLGNLLIAEKLAKPYEGGAKVAWEISDYDDYVKHQRQKLFGPYYEP